MDFTKYILATGAICGAGAMAKESDILDSLTAGVGVLLGVRGDWKTQRVNISTLELEAIPPVVPTLAEIKAQAKARASQRKWEIEVGGIDFGGETLATDDRSKLLITAAAEQARQNPAFSVGWKMADGNFVTVDAVTLIAAYDAVFAHVSACFAREAELAAQIDACANAEAVAALATSIEDFWP